MRANNDRKKNGWAQIFLFIIFLILLALVLNGMVHRRRVRSRHRHAS